jgi:putative transposase
MRSYKRLRIEGGCYFFTVNLAKRHGNDLLVRHIDDLREAIRITMRDHPFTIDAMVVLPDHLHCLWQMRPGDVDFPNRWRLIKARFSRCVARGERISVSRQRKGERGIWQRRYWEHAIRDEKDYQRHVDYIHYNPVKHGHVKTLHEWPHSSFMRWVDRGMYPMNWAAPPDIIECDWE